MSGQIEQFGSLAHFLGEAGIVVVHAPAAVVRAVAERGGIDGDQAGADDPKAPIVDDGRQRNVQPGNATVEIGRQALSTHKKKDASLATEKQQQKKRNLAFNSCPAAF